MLRGYFSITMLVASCPCALIMATPTAMVAGLSCAARLGILIKDVSNIELAKNITAFVFDKTGTLTTGELSVTQMMPVAGVDGADLLGVAASAEHLSKHPVARALPPCPGGNRHRDEVHQPPLNLFKRHCIFF